jgi:predicted  nucleic acid-binding Zn-ribbon protein
LNEQLELLRSLQEIDSTILSIADEVDQLSTKFGKDSLLLKKAQGSYNYVKSRHDAVIKKRKDREQELKEAQDKIEKSGEKSANLKTNKEYEAHLREIETLKKKMGTIEEDILVAMDKADAIAEELKGEDAKVKQAEEECRKDEELLNKEKDKLLSDMETYKAKRKEFIDRIDADSYERYMSLLKKLGGRAVVEADNEVCMGCNTNIPPQLYNEVKANDKIITCFYCHRYLYYKEK